MSDQEITDIGVMSGQPYGTAPLSADVQYLETYTSSALNRKMKGIVLPGFYLGFAPVAGTGLNVLVTSKGATGAQGAASIDVNAHQITIQQIADLTLPVVVGKTTRIVLEANYKIGTVTDQVNTLSTVKASRVFSQDVSIALTANQLELCRVVVPAGTTQVTQAMIVTTYRTNRQVGVTLDSIFTSDDELIAANLKGLKVLKGLIDKKMSIDQNGADISDKAAFRKNIGLDKLSVADDGSLVFEGSSGFKATGSGSFTSDGIALLVKQKTADKSYYIRGKKADDKLHWYIGQSADATDTVTWGNSIPNTWITLNADGTGTSNVSTMTFKGDLTSTGALDVSGGARITGSVNIIAKGATAVGDLTNAALYVCGNSADGTQGITVRGFAPSVAFIDATSNSTSFRWKADGNYMRLEADNSDNGATWNSYNTVFNDKGHLSLAGGGGSASRILTLGFGTAGNGNLTGASQISAMTYANIGADATTRAIGWGAEMSFGDGATAQTLGDAVEFWGNSNLVNANASITSMSSFRSYDKTNTNIAMAVAFDGRQMTRNNAARWNLYMQGSAPNYIRGQTIIGGTDTSLPASNFALDVRGDQSVSGALSVKGGGSFNASLTLGYRQMFQRDGAPGYQSFSRTDVTSAPTSNTELGRIVFGYGMNGKDNWGTNSTLGYISGVVMKGGGGQITINALNDDTVTKAGITLDGSTGTLDITGVAQFSSSIRANNYLDLGYQNVTAGKRQITFYSNSNTTQTGSIAVEGTTAAASTMTLTAGEVVITGKATIQGEVNFNGLIYANKHDGCISFSSSDAAKDILSVNYSGAGNFGFWNTTQGLWSLRKDVNDTWFMPAKLSVGGNITTAGEIVSNVNGNNIRLNNGTYSVLHRNYSSNYYILLTDSKDPDGNYNALRPITIALSNGLVTLGNSAKVTGDLAVSNRISIGNVGTGNFATSSASLNIGDSDTGFVCPTDGVIDVYGNNGRLMRFDAPNSQVIVDKPIVSGDSNAFRIISGNYGMIQRFDGSNYYMLLTAANDQNGTWSSLRPFAFNTSGDVTMSHNVTVGITLTANSHIYTKGNLYTGNGAAFMATDGNIYGPLWGGYLNNWINGRYVSDMRMGGTGVAGPWNGKTEWQTPGGHAVVGFKTTGEWDMSGNDDYIYYRSIQKCVAGVWYVIGNQ